MEEKGRNAQERSNVFHKMGAPGPQQFISSDLGVVKICSIFCSS